MKRLLFFFALMPMLLLGQAFSPADIVFTKNETGAASLQYQTSAGFLNESGARQYQSAEGMMNEL